MTRARPLRRRGRSPWHVLFACVAGIPAAVAAADAGTSQAPAAYVDRVLETGPQQEELDAQDERESAGLSRSLRVEYSLSSQTGNGMSERVQGLSVGGFVQTMDYGAFTADVTDSRTSGGNFERPHAPVFWRVDQRAFPLGGDWLAQHSAGHISTPLPAMTQGIGRVFIPSNPLEGIAGVWSRHGDLTLNASAGRNGLFYSGLDANGFQLNPGTITSAGAQWGEQVGAAREGRIDAAAQVLRATDAPSLRSAAQTDTNGAWASVAWQGIAPWANEIRGTPTSPMYERLGGLRVQGQWVRSTQGEGASAQGAWMDAAWRTEWLRNVAGVYRFDPGLRWGTLSLPGDLQGAYWRADVNTQRWQAGWLVEGDTSITGVTPAESFWSLYGRYRLNAITGIGGGVSVRTGVSAGNQLDLSFDRQSDFGQSAVRTRLLRTARSDFTSLSFDQIWPLQDPWTLSTSLTEEQQRGADGSGRRTIWGVLASYTGLADRRFDAAIRGARGNGMQSLNLNLAATWQIQRDWSLAARVFVSRGQEPQLTTLSSALTLATAASLNNTFNSRGVQIVLRYQWRAGNTPSPIGGAPGSGAGAVTGTVFMDVNANGRRDASEGGVANVEVVLDGRFVARTDSQGRYEFPAVVAGPHTIQIEPDNVPLPWSPVQRERVDIDVPVRGTSKVDFPLQREDSRS
jgi:hypothetical protein